MLKSNKLSLYIVILVAVAMFSMLLYAQTEFKNNKANTTIVSSVNGVWDLTEIDFSNSIVHLDGYYEHIEGRILSPEEFEELEHEAQIGHAVDYNTGRTARFTLKMPDNEKYMIYTVGDYARSVFVNGEFCDSAGQVSETKEGFEAGYKRISIQARPVDNQFELIIQGGNFVHREGGNYENIYIGNPDLLEWYLSFDVMIEVITAGVFVAIFLIYFILAITTKNYEVNLYFAILSFIWFVRLGLIGNKFFYDIIYDLQWIVAFKAEYVTYMLTVFFLCRIMACQLTKLPFIWVLKFLSYLSLFLAVMFLFLDTITMSHFVPYATYIFIVIIFYIVFFIVYGYIFQKPRIKPSFSDAMVIIGMLVLFACVINDSLYHINIYIFKNTLTEMGMIVFAIFEAIAIFYDNVNQFEQVKMNEEESRIRANELERFIKMKSHFIGIVAHEIKTPLSIIMGSAGNTLDIISEQDSDFTKEIHENQVLIKDTVLKVNETVFDLLDMTALETGRLSLTLNKVKVSNLIKEAIRHYQNQFDLGMIKLITDLDENCSEIIGDEKRLYQVLLNLLSNACRYSENSTISIKLWENDESQFISVIDEGEGISKEVLTKLKSDYVDGGPHGYRGGIGIYVCNQIIQAHGGTLDIQSELNKGTIVTIKLYKD